jgi:hypothetical protein
MEQNNVADTTYKWWALVFQFQYFIVPKILGDYALKFFKPRSR